MQKLLLIFCFLICSLNCKSQLIKQYYFLDIDNNKVYTDSLEISKSKVKLDTIILYFNIKNDSLIFIKQEGLLNIYKEYLISNLFYENLIRKIMIDIENMDKDIKPSNKYKSLFALQLIRFGVEMELDAVIKEYKNNLKKIKKI